MKRLTKQVLTLVLVCAMAVLAACGSSPAAESTPPPAEAAAPSETASQPAASDSVPVLTFWDMPWGTSEYQIVAEELVAKYNAENPNVQVHYQFTPWENSSVNFQIAVQSGAPLDVSTGPGYLSHQLNAMGEILPINDLIDEMTADGSIGTLAPGSLEQFNMDGVQVAIPFNMDLKGIFYRKDWLDAAGLKPPTNWDEMYEVCKALAHDDVYGIAMGGGNHWGFYTFMFGNGGSYVDENKQANFDSPEVKQTVEFIQKLTAEGLVPPGASGYTSDDAQRIFIQEKAVFYPGGADFGPKILAQGGQELYDATELLPVMTGPSGAKQSPCGMNGLMGYKKSEYPDEVKHFMKWWMSNNSDLWSRGGMGAFPTNSDLFKLPFVTENKFNVSFADLVAPYTVTLNWPHHGAFPAMNGIEGEDLALEINSEALSTSSPLDDSIASINSRVANILASN